MFKLLIALSILSFTGCKPTQPKEIPTQKEVPASKTLSPEMVVEMERVEKIAHDKNLSKERKICALEVEALIDQTLIDFNIYESSDPNRPDVDYELAEIRKFNQKCKKQYK